MEKSEILDPTGTRTTSPVQSRMLPVTIPAALPLLWNFYIDNQQMLFTYVECYFVLFYMLLEEVCSKRMAKKSAEIVVDYQLRVCFFYYCFEVWDPFKTEAVFTSWTSLPQKCIRTPWKNHLYMLLAFCVPTFQPWSWRLKEVNFQLTARCRIQ